ncbi:MAG: ATP synthase F0 subunit B [Lachnospiraceae bacterium]|nr:ATP synthase F0 subunit B [Lachnospiraceae bacterium]
MLSFDLVNFICMVINILIIFLLTKKFLFGRVNDIIEKRREEISDSYAAADKVTKEAQQTKKDYEYNTALFEKEKSEMMADARKEADEKSTAIVEKANADAAEIIKNAHAEAAYIKSLAELDRDKQVEEVVFDVAARLAGQAITEEANSDLYDKFLSQATGRETGSER